MMVVVVVVVRLYIFSLFWRVSFSIIGHNTIQCNDDNNDDDNDDNTDTDSDEIVQLQLLFLVSALRIVVSWWWVVHGTVHAVDTTTAIVIVIVIVWFFVIDTSSHHLKGILFQSFQPYVMTGAVLWGDGGVECLVHYSIRGFW